MIVKFPIHTHLCFTGYLFNEYPVNLFKPIGLSNPSQMNKSVSNLTHLTISFPIQGMLVVLFIFFLSWLNHSVSK